MLLGKCKLLLYFWDIFENDFQQISEYQFSTSMAIEDSITEEYTSCQLLETNQQTTNLGSDSMEIEEIRYFRVCIVSVIQHFWVIQFALKFQRNSRFSHQLLSMETLFKNHLKSRLFFSGDFLSGSGNEFVVSDNYCNLHFFHFNSLSPPHSVISTSLMPPPLHEEKNLYHQSFLVGEPVISVEFNDNDCGTKKILLTSMFGSFVSLLNIQSEYIFNILKNLHYLMLSHLPLIGYDTTDYSPPFKEHHIDEFMDSTSYSTDSPNDSTDNLPSSPINQSSYHLAEGNSIEFIDGDYLSLYLTLLNPEQQTMIASSLNMSSQHLIQLLCQLRADAF